VALRVRGFVTTGAAIAACMLIAACTPETPPVVNTPAPTASTPTANPTPTESEIERQMRLDYEAAESAYRGAVAEGERLSQQGGSKTASPKLKTVATGDYLTLQVKALRLLRSRGWHLVGNARILAVQPVGGWEATELKLRACEDNSPWKLMDKRGRDVTPDEKADYIQQLTLTKSKGKWKVADVSTRRVQSVERADCES